MSTEGWIARLPVSWQERLVGFALARRSMLWAVRRSDSLAMFVRMLVAFGGDRREVESTLAEIHALKEVPDAFARRARQLLDRIPAAEGEDGTEDPRALAHRAALYAFAGDWFTLSDARKRASYDLVLEAYDAYRARTAPPIEKAEILEGGKRVPAYFRAPEGDGRVGAVLIVQGFDTAKELWGKVEEALLARGLATLTIDPPGTGEALAAGRKLDGEEPIVAAGGAALAWLAGHPRVDPERVGLLGYSLGGYVAPRLAAEFPDRVAACCALGGPFDLSFWRALPYQFKKRALYVTGSRDEEELGKLLRDVDLTRHLRTIRCPGRVYHGEEDAVVPVQHARMIESGWPTECELEIVRGGDHALSRQLIDEILPEVADWFSAMEPLPPVEAEAGEASDDDA